MEILIIFISMIIVTGLAAMLGFFSSNDISNPKEEARKIEESFQEELKKYIKLYPDLGPEKIAKELNEKIYDSQRKELKDSTNGYGILGIVGGIVPVIAGIVMWFIFLYPLRMLNDSFAYACLGMENPLKCWKVGTLILRVSMAILSGGFLSIAHVYYGVISTATMLTIEFYIFPEEIL